MNLKGSVERVIPDSLRGAQRKRIKLKKPEPKSYERVEFSNYDILIPSYDDSDSLKRIKPFTTMYQKNLPRKYSYEVGVKFTFIVSKEVPYGWLERDRRVLSVLRKQLTRELLFHLKRIVCEEGRDG